MKTKRVVIISVFISVFAPNDSTSGRIYITSKEGYQEPVDLVISGLLDGVTTAINSQAVIAAETTVLTLKTEQAALGETAVTIEGTSIALNRRRTFKLALVEHVTDSLLPDSAK